MVPSAAPAHRDYTALLPTELLLHILGFFTFDDIPALLALSRRWRASTLSSPAYWDSITLESLDNSALKLFLLRLERSKGSPLAIRIDLWRLYHDATSVPWMTVLSALGEHLHHVTRLAVFVRSDMTGVWPVLRLQAPLLSHLTQSANREDRRPKEISVIPSDILCGHAPLLRSIEFVNMDLPLHPVPAFARVSDVNIFYTATKAVPNVFTHFPKLRTTSFTGCTFLEHPAYCKAESYKNITSCVWKSNRGSGGAPLPIDAVLGVQSVTIHEPCPQELELIFDQLRPPFVVSFMPDEQCPHEDFALSITEHEHPGQRRRGIVDLLGLWERNYDTGLTEALGRALAGKMHTLSIDAWCWVVLVQCVTTLPELRSLRIYISGTSELASMPPAQLAPLQLDLLEINAAQCAELSEMSVVNFVLRMFDPRVLERTRLVLANIHVFDMRRLLGELFADVQFLHDARCNFNDNPPRRSDVLAAR